MALTVHDDNGSANEVTNKEHGLGNETGILVDGEIIGVSSSKTENEEENGTKESRLYEKDEGEVQLRVFKKGEQYWLNPNELIPNPEHVRKDYDVEGMEEITQSIRDRGILQSLLFKIEGRKLILAAGERRRRAAIQLNMERIPCTCVEGDPEEISLVENGIRQNLSYIEQAEAYHKLCIKHEYSHEALAAVIGKGRSTISQTLSIMNIPDDVREECRNKKGCSRRFLVKLASMGTPEEIRKVFEEAKKNGYKIQEDEGMNTKNKTSAEPLFPNTKDSNQGDLQQETDKPPLEKKPEERTEDKTDKNSKITVDEVKTSISNLKKDINRLLKDNDGNIQELATYLLQFATYLLNQACLKRS